MLDPSHTYYFNSSVETEIIPEDWKSVNVTPIHKNESMQESGNYRPIGGRQGRVPEPTQQAEIRKSAVYDSRHQMEGVKADRVPEPTQRAEIRNSAVTD